MHTLAVNNIVNSYGGVKVLDGISFHADAGAFVSVVGPSGCGKSTLLNVICGLLGADSGSILVDGTRLDGFSELVSYMPQDDLLMPWRTTLDNVALPLMISGKNKRAARERAREYFEEFGLAGFENAYPHKLSGGMRQRAALLRTVLCNKGILLLDEPFGALDALTRMKMQDWLRSLLSSLSRTVVMVTHDITEALYLSDRVEVLSGRPARIVDTISTPVNRSRVWLSHDEAGLLSKRIYDALRGDE